MSELAIRRADPGDVDAINDLHRTVNGARRSRSEWTWEYERAPWGPAHVWLACLEGRVVGHWAWIPFKMRDGARQLAAFKSEGLMVHPDARRRGVAKRIVQAALDSESLTAGELIWTFPNAPAMTILTRAGYRDIGRIDALLALRHPVAVAFSRTPVGAPIVVRTARLLDRLWRRRAPRESSKWAVESPPHADGRFERLWSRVAGRCGLTVERSAAWLNWRFVDNPFIKYDLLVVSDHGGKPVGYTVVFRQQEGTLSFGYIADWVVDDSISGAAEAVMGAALRWFERKSVDVVLAYSVAGGPAPYASLAAQLRRGGPTVRRVNKTFIVLDTAAVGQRARPLTDWYVTESFTEGATL